MDPSTYFSHTKRDIYKDVQVHKLQNGYQLLTCKTFPRVPTFNRVPISAGGEVVPKVYMCNHIAEVRHAIFLSIILGGVAALPSTCIIIAIDFSMNIYEGFKIVRKHKKGLESKLKKSSALNCPFQNMICS